MTARYALYYTPPADHPLTGAASAWLGRDVWRAAAVERALVEGLDLDDAGLEALTASARHYGFHATLKAPFDLADGQSEAALIAALDRFAGTRAAFEGHLEVRSLSGFIAMVFAPVCPAMTALHTACVHEFEPFRAPISDADLARRRRSPMSAEQNARLQAFGYPWIFDDFRFHMTLTGRIADEAERDRIVAALARHFAPVLGAHRVDALCLFGQEDRAAPFRIVHSAAFCG